MGTIWLEPVTDPLHLTNQAGNKFKNLDHQTRAEEKWARRDSNPKRNAVQPLTDVNPKNQELVRDVTLLEVESLNNERLC